MVAAVLVQQKDDGFNVCFLDDVQGLWTLHQNAVENLKDPCGQRNKGDKTFCRHMAHKFTVERCRVTQTQTQQD